MDKINNLLTKMWNDYIELTPQAKKIVELLESRGELVENDHIALRTFDIPEVCIDVLAKPFLDSGYVEGGDYHFEEKKLYAKHFEHPNKSLPKVFISQLLIGQFSSDFQMIVKKMISSLKPTDISSFEFMISGRTWEVSSSEYERLQSESEYGAWLSAIGYRPNHFTIFINKLKNFKSVESLNTFLKEEGFKLNSAGGEVKGSKEVCLEQSSTLADTVEVSFSDKNMIIPSCYFEFAKRYKVEQTGEIYQGFVAKSADKIFESTNKVK